MILPTFASWRLCVRPIALKRRYLMTTPPIAPFALALITCLGLLSQLRHQAAAPLKESGASDA